MDSENTKLPENLSAAEKRLVKKGYEPVFSYEHGNKEGMNEYSSLTSGLRKDRTKYKTMHVESRCTVWVLSE